MKCFYYRIRKSVFLVLFISLFQYGCLKRKSMVDASVESAPCVNTPSSLSFEQREEILRLSDTKYPYAFDLLDDRMFGISEIFALAKDRRGILASALVKTTRRSVESIQQSIGGTSAIFKNPEMSKKLVVSFVGFYLDSLHGNLLGEKIPPEWQEYYTLAQDCKVSDLRILGTGLNTHLTYDLPLAVAAIGSTKEFEGDFLTFGSVLSEGKDDYISHLLAHHDIYAHNFFNGFSIGKSIDALFGKDSASRLAFTLVRSEAWTNGMLLQSKSGAVVARLGISAAWHARQEILRILPQSKP